MSSYSSPQDSPGVTEKVSNAARSATDKVKSRASEAAQRAKGTASEIVEDQKSNVADRIGGYGAALEQTAASIESDDPNIAWVTRNAAERLQRAADYFRNSNLTQLRNDAADVARRHPVAFFGGMFVAGAFLGAALRAGASAVSRGTEDETSYGEPEMITTASTDFTDASLSGSSVPETF